MSTCRWLVSLTLVLAATGCTGEPAPPSAEAPARVGPPNATVQPGETMTPPDRSLSRDGYAKAALPDPGRIWTGEDMKRAASVFEAMEQEGRGRLPRFQSPNSGEVFARLTADENPNQYRDRSLPLPQRFPDAIEFYQASSQVLKLYVAARERLDVGDSELVELMGQLLRTSVSMIQLVDEFLPTLDRDDPTYATRMEGLQRMKSGLATIVDGVLTTLTESSAYRVSELKRLAGFLELTLPGIAPALSGPAHDNILSRLRSLIADPAMHELKPELEKVLHAATLKEAQ